MTRDEIIRQVKALGWPKGSYIVFGSGPMAALGLRQADDIDLLVTKELHQKLRQAGWQEVTKGPKDKPVVQGVFEAHDNWDFGAYKPTLKHLLNSAMIIDGVPFASLEEVRKWKTEMARPKDARDLELIDAYLKQQV